MDRLEKFLEFVKKNPPPYLPGEPLYWLDNSTGEIIEDDDVENIIVILNGNWEWQVSENYDGDVINESQFYCTSREIAKRFRDKIEAVKYSVFNPDSNGTYLIDGKPYSYVKTFSLNPKEVEIDDDYFKAIFKSDHDVEVGSVIRIDRYLEYVLDNG